MGGAFEVVIQQTQLKQTVLVEVDHVDALVVYGLLLYYVVYVDLVVMVVGHYGLVMVGYLEYTCLSEYYVVQALLLHTLHPILI